MSVGEVGMVVVEKEEKKGRTGNPGRGYAPISMGDTGQNRPKPRPKNFPRPNWLPMLPQRFVDRAWVWACRPVLLSEIDRDH